MSLMHHPPEEMHQLLPLVFVGLLFVDEQPGHRRNRIGIWPGRIGQRHAKIFGMSVMVSVASEGK